MKVLRGAKVVVCNTDPGKVVGGSELFAAKLVQQLRAAGHDASLVTFPGPAKFSKESLMEAAKPWQDLDLTTAADVVIPLRFPTWVVKHPNKIVYLNHQLRAAYDLFEKPFGPTANEASLDARQFVMHVDQNIAMAKKIFAVSRNVQQRLKHYSDVDSELLYHGLPHEGSLHPGAYRDYVLSVGRLVPMKRVDLLIEAMAKTRSPVRCLIAGEGPEHKRLSQLIRKCRVQHKVKLLGRVTDDQLMQLYADALAVYYAPVDEDYGLVTLEAFAAEKPVLTATDSGGVLEFVQHGVNGCVLPPKRRHFAAAIDDLHSKQELAREMGKAGADMARQITWGSCVKRLEAFF